jgi:hypothetical protein
MMAAPTIHHWLLSLALARRRRSPQRLAADAVVVHLACRCGSTLQIPSAASALHTSRGSARLQATASCQLGLAESARLKLLSAGANKRDADDKEQQGAKRATRRTCGNLLQHSLASCNARKDEQKHEFPFRFSKNFINH